MLLGCSSTVAYRTLFVFLILIRTAVETAISGIHMLLRTGGAPISLPDIAVLAVAEGFFGLFCVGALKRAAHRYTTIFPPHPTPPRSPSLISPTESVDVKHHEGRSSGKSEFRSCAKVEVAVLDSGDDEVSLYVHRNRRLIRDGSPGRPPRLSHST